ncbi:enoyl-CoA hydratase/isomerase family protein [Nocardioides solisilvae]|uniref:enoyl-CoA hydratase/isomerase family protein n=1 Tax=Nocardioides solisilvae TaxID=1542435 RepID=UPI000D7404FD|nr:enoyl-CoA hydratase/isomerase family protein [Nocardioides solisilvae]
MAAVEVHSPAPHVTQITLNRPDRLNALDAGMVRDLSAALREVAADRDCRVVVLTGAGRGFCAGLDLTGYDAADGEAGDADDGGAAGGAGAPDPVAILARQREIAQLAHQLHSLPQPVIAAVNGAAAGGGLALVLASDVRVCVPSAVFAVSFIRAGYSACDIGVSWLLPRVVGAGRAHELMLTGRRCSSEEAHRIGLVTEVHEPDRLLEAALEKAAEIMLNPPFSVELTKQGMWLALETPSFATAVELENRQQVVTALTRDRAEATAAFLEKRAPRYEGR